MSSSLVPRNKEKEPGEGRGRAAPGDGQKPQATERQITRGSTAATDAALLGDDSIGKLQNSFKAAEDKERRCIVDDFWFKFSITIVVCLNTLQLGLEADYPELKESVWLVCENFFTAVFFIEMIIKVTVMKWDYLKDKANWLDALLTLFGVLDCWILSLMPGDTVDLQSMSIFRVLRLARLGRVVKLASRVKQFVLVISGVFKALVTTFWVFLLLVFVIYVCAIFCTEYIGRDEGKLYPGWARSEDIIDDQGMMESFNPYLMFGNMRNSMLTLFNIAIGGEWPEVVRPMAVKQPYFVLLFVMYSMLMAFGLMNVMMAIIVDSVIAESKRLDKDMQEQSKLEKRNLLERIEKLLNQIDSNDDQVVDLTELKCAYDKIPDLDVLLSKCDLPAGWSASELLFMLDNSGDGVLQKTEFTTSFFRLIDSDDFQQICIMQSSLNQVKHLIRQAHDKLEIHMAEVRRALCRIEGVNPDDNPAKLKADTTLDGESDDGVIHCDFDEAAKGVQLHNGTDNSTNSGPPNATKADTALDGESETDVVHCDFDEMKKVQVHEAQQGCGAYDGVTQAAPTFTGQIGNNQMYCEDNGLMSAKENSTTSFNLPRADLQSAPVTKMVNSKQTREPLCAVVDDPTSYANNDQPRYALQSLQMQEQFTTQELRSDFKSVPLQKITEIIDATCLAVKDSLLREFAVALQAEELSAVSQSNEASAKGPPSAAKCRTLAEESSSTTISGAPQPEICSLPQPEEEAEEGPVLNFFQGANHQQSSSFEQSRRELRWQPLTSHPTSPTYDDGCNSAAAGEDFVSVASDGHNGDARSQEVFRGMPSSGAIDGNWCVDVRFEHEESLGFEIRWHPDHLPLVGTVLHGSVSDLHGILPGDQLTQCNGVSVENKCRPDVLLLLKERPLVLRLQRHSHV